MNISVPKLTPWLKCFECKMHVWFCLFDLDHLIEEEACFEATKPDGLCTLKGLLTVLFQQQLSSQVW